LAILLVSFLASACGGSDGSAATSVGTDPGALCDWFAHQPYKNGDCGPLVTDVPVYPTMACISALTNSCDAADRAQIDGFIDCYLALPSCTRPNEVTFSSQIFLCQHDHGVKVACSNALSAIAPAR
jgi:hypothetical protein